MKQHSILAALLAAFALVIVPACGGSPTKPGPVPIVTPPPPVEEPPPPPPDPPTLTVTRILAFGDSLTQGGSDGLPLSLSPWGGITSHLEFATSYPSQLREMLKGIYTSQTITVVNAGSGGEQPIRSATRERLMTELDDHNPQVLLLMHGVNSLSVEYNAGNDDAVEDTADAVDELIEKARSRKPGIRVMLATLPRQRAGASGKVVAAHLVVPFNTEMRQLALEEGADLVDIYAVISESMLTPDGLHITEAGNLKMAETFYAKIKARYHREPQ